LKAFHSFVTISSLIFNFFPISASFSSNLVSISLKSEAKTELIKTSHTSKLKAVFSLVGDPSLLGVSSKALFFTSSLSQILVSISTISLLKAFSFSSNLTTDHLKLEIGNFSQCQSSKTINFDDELSGSFNFAIALFLKFLIFSIY
jgi:hypothetical protein